MLFLYLFIFLVWPDAKWYIRGENGRENKMQLFCSVWNTKHEINVENSIEIISFVKLFLNTFLKRYFYIRIIIRIFPPNIIILTMTAFILRVKLMAAFFHSKISRPIERYWDKEVVDHRASRIVRKQSTGLYEPKSINHFLSPWNYSID